MNASYDVIIVVMNRAQKFQEELKEQEDLSLQDFWGVLKSQLEEALPCQYVFYFEEEDLLNEVRFVFGNEEAQRLETDQYFYHFKDLAYQNLKEEPKLSQEPNRTLPRTVFHSKLFYPVDLSGRNRGILVMVNPSKKKNFSEKDIKLLKDLFSTTASTLSQLKIQSAYERALKEIELIDRITQIVDMSNITSFFFQCLIELIEETIDCQAVIFLMFNEEKSMYYLEAGNDSGCEFWVSQTEFFRSLAKEAEQRGVFCESYGGKYFKGEKYGLDRLETALVVPMDFYHKSTGMFILLNKNEQKNFNNLDVKLMSIISGYTKAIIYRELEKKDLIRLFKRFVSEDVGDRLLSANTYDLSLEDKENITVLFVDLNGFTSFAETTDASQVTRQLNSYFQEMTNLIDQYGGTLDKYLGDGIMALFGARGTLDNHAERSVECALAMQERMSEMTQIWVEEGFTPLTASIGVCTGEALVGAIGCDKFMDYTAIGDTINVASRLCDHARNGRILISESTWKLIQDVLDCDLVDELKVKGKRMAVNAYEVRGIKNIYEVRDSLRNGEDKIKFRILRALGRFQSYQEFDAVLDYIDHVNPEIRLASIETVGRLNKERHLSRIIEYMDLEKVQKIRTRILSTINSIAVDPLTPLVNKYLKGLAPGVKPTVLKATVQSPNRDDRRLFLALIKAFQDRDEARSTMLADLTNLLYQDDEAEIIPLLREQLPRAGLKYQIAIISAFSKLDVPQIASALISVLDQPGDRELLMTTAKAMGKIQNQKTIKVLSHLSYESSQSKHWYKYFVCRQKPGTTEPYQQLLKEEDEFLLFASLTHLCSMDVRPIVDDLLSLMTRSEQSHIQLTVIDNLKFLPAEQVMTPFIKQMDRNPGMTQAVLSEIGFRKQGMYLEYVHKYMDHEDPMVQMAAVTAAGKLGDPASLDPLLKILRDTDNANLQATIMNNLGNFEDEKAVEPLMEALYSPIGRIRANAIDSLLNKNYSKSIDRIERLLQDDNNRVRANAALACIQFGKVQAFGVLTEMAKSSNKWMRLSCLWALSKIKLPESRNVIFGMLKDPDYDVVLSAVQFLKRMH